MAWWIVYIYLRTSWWLAATMINITTCSVILLVTEFSFENLSQIRWFHLILVTTVVFLVVSEVSAFLFSFTDIEPLALLWLQELRLEQSITLLTNMYIDQKFSGPSCNFNSVLQIIVLIAWSSLASHREWEREVRAEPLLEGRDE
jgi:hypothetical protein